MKYSILFNKEYALIYLAETKVGLKKFVKIGYSQSPEQRVRELQTGCPTPIKLVAKKPGNQSEERRIHRRLWIWNKLGEWYIDREEIREIFNE